MARTTRTVPPLAVDPVTGATSALQFIDPRTPLSAEHAADVAAEVAVIEAETTTARVVVRTYVGEHTCPDCRDGLHGIEYADGTVSAQCLCDLLTIARTDAGRTMHDHAEAKFARIAAARAAREG